MFRETLDRAASAALTNLMCALAALRELAWLNHRMTAKGLTAIAVFVAAHYGLELSAEWQVFIASVLFAYLGVVGRDKPRRRTP